MPLNYDAPKAGLAGPADQARQAAGHQQTEQAHAALAGALMERLPEGERSDTWLTYGERKHHHAFTTLADALRANESQQRALELSAPSRTMTRSLLRIDAAACSHRDVLVDDRRTRRPLESPALVLDQSQQAAAPCRQIRRHAFAEQGLECG